MYYTKNKDFRQTEFSVFREPVWRQKRNAVLLLCCGALWEWIIMQEEKEILEISGTVESVTFRNEESGFTVFELNTGREMVTVVGVLAAVMPGEQLRVSGGWTVHATFGQQFRAEMVEHIRPKTSSAIFRFLASGAIKGVGAVTAKHLVNRFGDQTLEIIENEPERLCELKGITPMRAQRICAEFKKMFGVREVMLFLGEYGVTPAEAMRVWKVWGVNTVERVKMNPYLLCTEGLRIGFERADAIAQAMGFAADDHMRVRAGTVHVLRHNCAAGHTCLPRDQLAQTAAAMLNVPVEQVEIGLTEMVQDATLEEELLQRPAGLRPFIFMPSLHRAELYAAGRLRMMLAFPPQRFYDVDEDIDRIENELGIRYEARQKDAITRALSQGILILTGGPGTGKTTTLNAMIRILKDRGQRVALAAPTGRAAKRMSELTGQEAKTIHRLLEVGWDQEDHPIFGRNEKNLLECDALIVDELSMVDSALFSSLLCAMPLGCRLVLVGDSDQLPSVGPGDVLHELIASGVLPVVQLQEVFRQSLQSLIIANAHRIVRGEMPDLRDRKSDFFFLPDSSRESIQRTIVELCTVRLPKRYGYSPFGEIQVLCPGRKGELGVSEMNLQLQQAVNPPAKQKREVTLHSILFREGDKVMQIKNDYDISWTRPDGTCGSGVFNGDVGILEKIDRATQSMVIRFDDRETVYAFDLAENLDLAYAATVHKSQGNEFEAVVMPMYPGPPQLYYRNLLYTAVTRAKSLLILVGRADVVARMVENNRRTKRYSGLSEFLIRGE